MTEDRTPVYPSGKALSRDVELAPGSDTRYRDVSTDNEQILMSTVA